MRKILTMVVLSSIILYLNGCASNSRSDYVTSSEFYRYQREVNKKLTSLENDYSQIYQKLEAFKIQPMPVPSHSNQDETQLYQRVSKLESLYNAVYTQLNRVIATIQSLPTMSVPSQPDNNYAQVYQRISRLESLYNDVYTQLNRVIAALQSQPKATVSPQPDNKGIALLDTRISRIENELSYLKQQINALPKTQQPLPNELANWINNVNEELKMLKDRVVYIQENCCR